MHDAGTATLAIERECDRHTGPGGGGSFMTL